MNQQVEFAKNTLTFQTGTGKDAKIFVKFSVKDDDDTVRIYNIPLTTISSLQVWTSKPKIARYQMGSADPVGLSTGIRSVTGFITGTTENESIGAILRKMLKEYKPVKASALALDTDGIVTIEQLDEVRYLDQLPPCQICIFLSNPVTGHVFSKSIYGVVFSAEGHSIGTSATMGAQYSFIASNIGPIMKEDISESVTTTE